MWGKNAPAVIADCAPDCNWDPTSPLAQLPSCPVARLPSCPVAHPGNKLFSVNDMGNACNYLQFFEPFPLWLFCPFVCFLFVVCCILLSLYCAYFLSGLFVLVKIEDCCPKFPQLAARSEEWSKVSGPYGASPTTPAQEAAPPVAGTCLFLFLFCFCLFIFCKRSGPYGSPSPPTQEAATATPPAGANCL